MKSSQLIAVLVAVIAIIWIGTGFFVGDDGTKAETMPIAQRAADTRMMQVRVREIKAVPYADNVVVTGRSQASRSVELKAEISGAIGSIDKEEGMSVEEGDVLAVLEIRDRKARKSEAQERVNQRQIEYNAAKKLADKGFNSQVRLAQSLADLEDAKAALSEANLNLAKTNIEAPFEGIIYDQAIDLGDFVSPGDIMFTIVDLDPIEFVGYISERRINEIETGMQTPIELLNGEVVMGEISYIAPAADPETRTFRVVVSAANPELKVRDGLTATLAIPVSNKIAHKISPSILSLNDAGQIGVKIVNAQNVVEFIPVRILADKPDAMWITGPNETSRFITVGQEFVVEGQTVDPIPAEGDGLL